MSPLCIWDVAHGAVVAVTARRDLRSATPGAGTFSIWSKPFFLAHSAASASLRQSKSKRGAAGVDGQSFEDIQKYGEGRWLKELQCVIS